MRFPLKIIVIVKYSIFHDMKNIRILIISISLLQYIYYRIIGEEWGRDICYLYIKMINVIVPK